MKRKHQFPPTAEETMTRFLFLAVALLALSVPVQAGIIFDFNDVGTLNYVTGANPLVGRQSVTTPMLKNA